MRSDRIDTPSGVVLVAQQPAIDELEAQATAQELESVVQYSSPSRRRERLAWRRLVREYLGKEPQIEYLSSGAPIILNSPYKYISVSHSRTHVAVMLSSVPCGVDIESMERDFGRVASRYVSDGSKACAARSGGLRLCGVPRRHSIRWLSEMALALGMILE